MTSFPSIASSHVGNKIYAYSPLHFNATRRANVMRLLLIILGFTGFLDFDHCPIFYKNLKFWKPDLFPSLAEGVDPLERANLKQTQVSFPLSPEDGKGPSFRKVVVFRIPDGEQSPKP
jgi:hypothetical protein